MANALTSLMDRGTPQIINDTIAHVNAFWREHGVPMLLSALGNVEHGRISREAKRQAEGLRAFLEVTVGDHVMVVEHSKNPTVVGVVPRNEVTRGIQDWDSLLDKPGPKTTLRRLHPAFWAALRKPISDSMERYVQSGESESVRFTDVAGGDDFPNGVRLGRQFIVGLEASSEEVHKAAMTWLNENNLDISNFLPETGLRTSAKLPSNDLLGKLVLALGERDLQRISIPMDVVAKLRRQTD